jgi:hypothetical protein
MFQTGQKRSFNFRNCAADSRHLLSQVHGFVVHPLRLDFF